ncbi:alpha/beta hydrolase [Diaphorobacter ruginosibacter]|uniref:alpha/beta hydrolase n=1 Tax=Diaphorobacter ruginosibacter TaxID=1715720 RepID=UPI001FE6F550|nr:alpha/beta hydrolase [Diaphorobacter ruginosibacter]
MQTTLLREPALTAQLRALGLAWQSDIRDAGDRTKALYAPLLAAAPKDGVSTIKNLHYGPDERQVLDIYRPEKAAETPAPVFVFVHGGAFLRGAKDINGEMYGNVLTWFARQGCVGVNVEYRLAPGAAYPGGAQDVALACDWIAANIEDWGGDARRICLIGHSAGGRMRRPMRAIRRWGSHPGCKLWCWCRRGCARTCGPTTPTRRVCGPISGRTLHCMARCHPSPMRRTCACP